MTMAIPDLNAFVPLLNETFGSPAEDGTPGASLILVEARALDARGRPAELLAPFELIFRCPGDSAAEQGMYRLYHPALGDFALFLVPIAQQDGHVDYCATIN